MRKRIFCLFMVFNMILMSCPTVFGESRIRYNDGICEHHIVHDEKCGYQEEIPEEPCTHEHDENCGYEEEAGEESCTHEHDEDCGYQEGKKGSPCEYLCDICEGEKESDIELQEEIREEEEVISYRADTDIAYPVTGGNIYFDETTGSITGCDEEVTEAIIPSKINGIDVISVSYRTFANVKSLTNIELPDSITTMGNELFYGCRNLTNIKLPNRITTIGSGMFSGCSNLTSIKLPTSVVSIGTRAFSGCINLKNIEIPNSVVNIFSEAFVNCSKLENIELPNTVTTISGGLFSGCINLKNIEISSNTTNIGENAFNDCNSLTNIKIPNSVKDIGRFAFTNCSSLTNIEIPDGIKYIRNYIFNGCSSLTNIKIPNSITSIGEYAFANCGSLTSVEIPNGVTSIRDGAFQNCISLKQVKLPNSLIAIERNVFDGCSNLASIEIPNSVTSMGEYVFNNCSGLTNVKIPNSVTSIGEYAFNNCSSLISLKISNKVTSIKNCTFRGCSNLTSIHIPDSITFISYNAFNDNLKDIYYSGSEEEWNKIDNRMLESLGVTIHYNYTGSGEDIGKSSQQVRFFNDYNEEGKKVFFDYSSLAYSITDNTDMSFISSLGTLLNKYVLVNTENGNSNILSIKPVESKIGTVTGVDYSADSKITHLTIDGTKYPIDENMFTVPISKGNMLLYHIYESKIVGLDFLVQKTGTLEAWDDSTQTATIDGTEYPTNYVSDITGIDQFLENKISFYINNRISYTPLIKISGTVEDLQKHIVSMYPEPDSILNLWNDTVINCSITFDSDIESGTGKIYLKDYETGDTIRTFTPDNGEENLDEDAENFKCIGRTVHFPLINLNEESPISCDTKFYFEIEPAALWIKNGNALSETISKDAWSFSTAFGLTKYKDHVSFGNKETFFLKKGEKGYPIKSEELQTKLRKMIGVPAYIIHTKKNYSGACFGTSIVTVLNKMNIIDVTAFLNDSDFDDSSKTLYNMKKPVDSVESNGVRDLVLYHHLLQNIDIDNLTALDVKIENKNRNKENFIETLKEIVTQALNTNNNKEAIQICFGWMDKNEAYCHSVVICSAKENENGSYDLLVRDPNYTDNFQVMEVAADYSSLSYLEDNIILIKLIDVKKMPSDWLIGTPNTRDSDTISQHSNEDYDILKAVAYDNFEFKNNRGEILKMESGYLSGNMEVLAEDFIESGMEDYAEFVFKVPKSEEYTFTSDSSRSSCTVKDDDRYIFIDAQNASNIVMNMTEGVSVNGNNLDYSIYATTANSNNFFSVSGKTDSYLNIDLKEDGSAKISADTLKGATLDSLYEEKSFTLNDDNDKVEFVETATGGLTLSKEAYTITFNGNGGTASVASMTTGNDGMLSELPTATRNNYVFDGWYTSANGGTKVNKNKVYIEDTILYAHWLQQATPPSPSIPSNKYTITYDSNGGSGEMKSDTVEQGKEFTLPNCTFTAPDGKEFKAWKIENKEYAPNDTYLFTNDTTVYAVWKEIDASTYTINFDANGGTVTPSKMITQNDGTLSSLPTPTRNGYTFKGWYTSANGGVKVNENEVYSKDTTLYAKWEKKSSTGSSRGSSGSKSSSTLYDITIPTINGGTISVDPKSASHGRTISIIATPNAGYELSSLEVVDANKNNINLTSKDNKQYTFTMPNSAVEINAKFQAISNSKAELPQLSSTWNNPFTDISNGTWYYDAVKFVDENNLMSGYGNGIFAPNANLSRAMLAQILYNKEGQPTVTNSNIFTDVSNEMWYAKAITWAEENGFVSGYGNNLFGPNDNITREQLAMILWRYAGSPLTENVELHFNDTDDVSDYALTAVKWAVEKGIMSGYGDGLLNPKGFATRAQVAQMFKNYLQKQ